jgi:zinc transport system substrate-binding protein
VGDKAETFLQKSLATIARRAERVRLLITPGLILHSTRLGGAPPRGGALEGRKTRSGHPDEVDPHIWLDPGNAKTLTSAIATALIRADPHRRGLYRANEKKMACRLDALDGDIRAQLAPVLRRPYVVFHDAFQYFEKRYGLNMVGAITTSPERRPGAKRIAQIRAQIGAEGAVCVFTEPQFTPGLARVVLEGTGARMGALDPLGAALPPGPGMYFALMRGLANSLLECLAS